MKIHFINTRTEILQVTDDGEILTSYVLETYYKKEKHEFTPNLDFDKSK